LKRPTVDPRTPDEKRADYLSDLARGVPDPLAGKRIFLDPENSALVYIKKTLRRSVGFLAVIGLILVCGALLMGTFLGSAAVATYLTPWLLIITIPMGIGLTAFAMTSGSDLMEKAVKWSENE